MAEDASQKVAPSLDKDGVSEETEEQLRNFGAGLIQGAGQLLRVPQLVVASAAALFQRFYCQRSFAEFEVRAVAGAALSLACKLEETHRTMKDVILMVHRLQMRALKEDSGVPTFAGRPVPKVDEGSKEFADMKREVLRAERFILRELGFDATLFLDHPHKYILQYTNALSFPRVVLQKAWNYLNDSLRTKLCCLHHPEKIALASLLLSARTEGVKLPENPSLWEALNVQPQSVKHVAEAMLALYTKPPGVHILVTRRPPPLSRASRLDLSALCPARSPSDLEFPAETQDTVPPSSQQDSSQQPQSEPAVAPAAAPAQTAAEDRKKEKEKIKERDRGRDKGKAKKISRQKRSTASRLGSGRSRDSERSGSRSSSGRSRSARRRGRKAKTKEKKPRRSASSLSGSPSSSCSRRGRHKG